MYIRNLFIVSIIFIAACNTSKYDPKADESTTYIPFTEGTYREYKVTLTAYTDVNQSHDSIYYIKEKVGETLTFGAQSRKVLNRFYGRSQGIYLAQPDSVWNGYIDNSKYVRYENNVPRIALSFPIENSRSWNGAAIHGGDDSYVYKNVLSNYTLNGKVYSKTLTVSQEDEKNLVEKKYRAEVYAQDIGMIYKKDELLKYAISNPNLPPYTPFAGKILVYELVGYEIK